MIILDWKSYCCWKLLSLHIIDNVSGFVSFVQRSIELCRTERFCSARCLACPPHHNQFNWHNVRTTTYQASVIDWKRHNHIIYAVERKSWDISLIAVVPRVCSMYVSGITYGCGNKWRFISLTSKIAVALLFIFAFFISGCLICECLNIFFFLFPDAFDSTLFYAIKQTLLLEFSMRCWKLQPV